MNPSPTSSPFQFANFGSQPPPQQQQQQQQQQQLQQQQFQQQQFQQMPGLVAPHIHLRSTDGTPLSYQAKWSDIHDDSKNLLLAIEEKMLEYRDESRRLDQCQRLYDSAALHKGFELESVRISQELGGVGAAVVIEQSSLEEMVQTAKVLMRNAEVAVRSFMMLRHHFSRLKVPAVAPAGSTPSAGPLALGFSHTPSTAAPAAPPSGPTADFYSGIPSKPSQFLQQTVSRFDAQLSEYGQRIEELERLLQDGNAGQVNGRSSSELSLLQSLPTVMTNVHDFFIHVAAEVESLHQQIEAMRIALIADRRRRGDDMNPFLEADRREVAKREVAAKRVHPTLNGPMTPLATHMPGMDPRAAQTPVPFGGAGSAQSMPSSASPLFGSAQGTPSMFAPSSAAAQFTPSTVAPTVGSGSFSTFSMFGASTPSSSIFGANTGTPAGSTPASNLFGAGTATSLFGGSPATPFGTFGQNQASGPKQMARATTSATPLFSMANTPTAATPLFGATPTVQTPLFGTPASGTGAAAAVKPKPRGPRRK